VSSKRAGRRYFCRFASCTVGSSLRAHNPEEVFSALVREFHDTVRDLGVHLHCAADIEDANMQKRPYCMALRDAGSFEPLVKDPHYLLELQHSSADVSESWAGQNIYNAAGVDADQASALFLFQMVGCYTAAMSCSDDAVWEKTRVSIDAFIRAGLGGIASVAVDRTRRRRPLFAFAISAMGSEKRFCEQIPGRSYITAR